ncbi:MAG: hypothetical protein JWM19_647 [Actinomycetia bacterium]|nr:hypothetical protein [Actinomycetes bacterium]
MSRVLQALSRGPDQALARRSAPGYPGDYRGRFPGACANAVSAPGLGTLVDAGSRHLRGPAGGVRCCR